MKNYDFIFVVLVYRNTADLKDFFANLSVQNSKTIVVNSFYDQDTEVEFNSISKLYNADFLSVPNKGYGAGNNIGIKHALDNYDFKYLVISNADIIVKDLSLENVKESVINAPNIINRSGRMQNPMQPYESALSDWVKYNCFKKKIGMLPIYMCIAINKLACIVFRLTHNGGGYIYSCHGSFLIIPRKELSVLYPLYNEQQFLFGEEDHLAYLSKSKNVRIYYNPKIRILHKEDGSVGAISDKVMELIRVSYIKMYEYWHK